MKKIPQSVYYAIFTGLFGWLLVVSFNSSKRKPDSVGELFTD